MLSESGIACAKIPPYCTRLRVNETGGDVAASVVVASVGPASIEEASTAAPASADGVARQEPYAGAHARGAGVGAAVRLDVRDVEVGVAHRERGREGLERRARARAGLLPGE